MRKANWGSSPTFHSMVPFSTHDSKSIISSWVFCVVDNSERIEFLNKMRVDFELRDSVRCIILLMMGPWPPEPSPNMNQKSCFSNVNTRSLVKAITLSYIQSSLILGSSQTFVLNDRIFTKIVPNLEVAFESINMYLIVYSFPFCSLNALAIPESIM